MSTSSATGTIAQSGTDKSETGFGAKNLKANAALYRQNKRILDGASSFDNLDDALAALTDIWTALEAQIEHGSGFTPPVELGFGSDNAAVIAESLLGRRNTVGKTRKSFSELGK